MNNILNRKIINNIKQDKIPFILSPVQIKILHYLFEHSQEIIYQRDIEKMIESRRSTTSGILNTMEKNNLIKRVSSQNDARSKQIILTNFSKKLSHHMIEQKEKFEEKLCDSIAKEELDIFFKVTEKLKNNIMNMK